MKFDKYNRTARIYPSILILIPFLLFTIYCDIDNLKDVFDDLLKVKIIGNHYCPIKVQKNYIKYITL